jgi:transposase InsO family protein
LRDDPEHEPKGRLLSINAVAESFFATIKGEMPDHQAFAARAEATAAIADYVDAFYNVHRLHSLIGYVRPLEFAMTLSMETNQAVA